LNISPWLLATRPKTLPAAIVPVWVGSVIPYYGQTYSFSWLLFWATLLGCLCIQIATNLFNDAVDAKKGADTEERLGPKRVTASGLLSRKAVMLGALGFCVLAALISIPLVQARGWWIILIGIVSLYFSYGYTGGPWPLAYKGLGELFVILFFGFVAVVGTFFVQAGEFDSPAIWVLGLQCGLYSCVLIAINNLRDVKEDRKTGKYTLAVRFGKTFARWEIAFFCVAPVFLWLVCWKWEIFLGAIFVHALFATLIIRGVWRNEPGTCYNKFLGMGAVQLILFAAHLTLVCRIFSR